MSTVYKSKLTKKHTVEKHHSLYTCNIEQSNMSSNTNQTPATPEQQRMAALQASLGPTTSASTKEVKNLFIGRKTPGKESEEVTAVDNVDDNPPEKDKEGLGQCSSYKIKGQKDSRCKQQGTVRPHKGNTRKNHLVYCTECWEIRREKTKRVAQIGDLRKRQKLSRKNNIFSSLLIRQRFRG